jgi:hypothetical protein
MIDLRLTKTLFLCAFAGLLALGTTGCSDEVLAVQQLIDHAYERAAAVEAFLSSTPALHKDLPIALTKMPLPNREFPHLQWGRAGR